MRTSPRGFALIKKWEGLYLKAYKDIAGIWTIGYGTIADKLLGISVFPGMTITKERAEELLRVEVTNKDKFITSVVKVPLTSYQFDAISSFTFNTGKGALQKSTLLRLLNRGDYDSVPNQLLRWSYSYDEKTGTRRVVTGLLNRRKDEVLMWQGKAISSLPPLPEELTKVKVTPQINEQAGKRVLHSTTAKLILAKLGMLGAVASAHPELLMVLLGIGLCSVYVLYRKYMDAREIF